MPSFAGSRLQGLGFNFGKAISSQLRLEFALSHLVLLINGAICPVMVGLIHVFPVTLLQDVDARDKPGHDEL
jgi:hypothetical protein